MATTTLIIRDATLAINGSPNPSGDATAHLLDRIEEVAKFEEPFLADCLDVLGPSVKGKSSDAEAVEAVVIIALARPELAQQKKVSAISAGRKLAAMREKRGDSDTALALLETLVGKYPGHKALERDFAGLMRRQGMVGELVDRYLKRSQELLREGRNAEAISWLREILVLDRSRKDVARTIRDLRFQEIDKVENKRSRRRVAIVTLVASVLLFAGLLREFGLAQEYRTIPEAQPGDLVGMKERLASLESFVEKHPIWHGSLKAVAERTDIRLEVDRVADAERLIQDRRQADLEQRLEEAELARKRGVMLAQDGNYPAALEEFKTSMRMSTPDWEGRGRVQRDIDAISAFLEENQ